MTRVLLVDDHPVVLSGLKALLGTEPGLTVVGAAASGEEALALVEALRPDVVLSDLRLGAGLDGVGLVTELRRRDDPPAVVILTTYDNDADIARAVLAGASGYLLKDADPATIAAAVAAAAAGESVLAPEQERRVADRLVAGVAQLSARELEVMRLVAAGRSNREIARGLFVSEATVKTHLVHAFGKLGAASRTEAVARAQEQGLL